MITYKNMAQTTGTSFNKLYGQSIYVKPYTEQMQPIISPTFFMKMDDIGLIVGEPHNAVHYGFVQVEDTFSAVVYMSGDVYSCDKITVGGKNKISDLAIWFDKKKCEEYVDHDPRSIKYVQPEILTDAMVEKAFDKDPSTLIYAPERILTDLFIKKMIAKDPKTFKHINKCHLTSRICEKFARADADTIKFMDDCFLTESVYEAAIKNDGRIISQIKKPTVNHYYYAMMQTKRAEDVDSIIPIHLKADVYQLLEHYPSGLFNEYDPEEQDSLEVIPLLSEDSGELDDLL